MRSSGKHTEEHHLIRCLAPEKTDDKDKAVTEQRLTSMEGRLQTQLDDLTGRVGDLNGRMGDLNGRVGDLTGRVEDLTGRMGISLAILEISVLGWETSSSSFTGY
ncbi:hypothetical protein BJV77DRAFT_193809 [Russula vinacea]|nr:hypothetical protein BJV77DRAFT_193809 [Russula vinacea]